MVLAKVLAALVSVFILTETILLISGDSSDEVAMMTRIYTVGVYILALVYTMLLLLVHVITLNAAAVNDIQFLFELVFALFVLIGNTSMTLILRILTAPLYAIVSLIKNDDLTNTYNTLIDVLSSTIGSIFNQSYIDSVSRHISDRVGIDVWKYSVLGYMPIVIPLKKKLAGPTGSGNYTRR